MIFLILEKKNKATFRKLSSKITHESSFFFVKGKPRGKVFDGYMPYILHFNGMCLYGSESTTFTAVRYLGILKVQMFGLLGSKGQCTSSHQILSKSVKMVIEMSRFLIFLR